MDNHVNHVVEEERMRWRGFSLWTLFIIGLIFTLLSAAAGFIFSLIAGAGLLVSLKVGAPAAIAATALIIITSIILTGMLVVVVYQWGARRK